MTASLPIFGGEIDKGGWESFYAENIARLMNTYKLGEGTADMLIRWYGSELPFFESILEEHGTTLLKDTNIWMEAQVIYSCRVELAIHPIDFLRRRTQIMFERNNGLDELDRVADLMQKELNWDTQYRNKMIEETKDYINKYIVVQ